MKNKETAPKQAKRAPFVIIGTEAPLCGVPVVKRPKNGKIKMPPIKVNTPVQTVYVGKKDDDDDDFFDSLF